MQMGFLGGLTVAGLILLAALTGVVVVKMTTSGVGRDSAAYAAVAPAAAPPVVTSAPALIVNPLTGQSQFARTCNGAVAEAKAIGVLPDYAKMNSSIPRAGGSENVCSATTQSAQWDVAFFSRCTDGRDSCPVLARVTQEGQYVVFRRD